MTTKSPAASSAASNRPASPLDTMKPSVTKSTRRTPSRVDLLGHLRQALPLRQVGDAAGKLDHVDAAPHVAAGHPRDHLAGGRIEDVAMLRGGDNRLTGD